MRPYALAFAAICLVLTGVGGYLVASVSTRTLEARAEAQVRTALNAAGQEWAEVNADGMILRLTGSAQSEQDRLAAIEAVARIVGFERLYDSSRVIQQQEVPRPAFRLEIHRNGDEARVFGLLSEADTPKIGEYLAAEFGVEADTSLIVASSFDAPSEWPELQQLVLQIAGMADYAKLLLTEDRLEIEAIITGEGQSQAYKEELIALIGDRVPFSIQTLESRVPVEHFRISISTKDGGSFTDCVAQTPEGRDKILGAARAIGIGELPECLLGLGAPVKDWELQILPAIQHLDQLNDVNLTIKDTEIAITLSTAENAETKAVIGRIQEAVGPPFTISVSAPAARMETPGIPEAAERPAIWFSVISDREGNALMAGHLSETVQQPLRIFAEAQFGLNRVEDDFEPSATLPPDWTQWIFVIVEAMGMLASGDALLSENGVTISGISHDPQAEAGLVSLLKEKIGPDFQMILDIDYEAPPAPEELLPDPELCATDIANVLGGEQISFAPSSAVIEETSMQLIAEIAEILNKCRHAQFEIGGHTDSQGREEMNRNLSQSRAESVLDALLAQNLLLGELSAVGYGESQPIADNETEEGRAANRRIEFKLLGVTDGQD